MLAVLLLPASIVVPVIYHSVLFTTGAVYVIYDPSWYIHVELLVELTYNVSAAAGVFGSKTTPSVVGVAWSKNT